MAKDFIVYSGIFIFLVNTIIYLKSYRGKPVAFKLFSYYLLVIFSIQCMSTYYFEKGINNIHLSHYYFIVQFVFLSLFFRDLMLKKILKKLIFLLLVATLVYLSIYYIIYPKNYYIFNISEILLTSIPLAFYCLLFFFEKIDNPDKDFIYTVSGFFIYILCSILLFSVGNISSEIKMAIWYSNAVLFIIYQTLIFVEWYKHFRTKKSPV